jgi:hypothetical protein
MELFSRIRGVASPEGRVGALRKELYRVRSIRLRLYQNDERIGQVFEQRRSNVTEVLAGGGLTLETSGGVLGFVTGKASKTRSASETIQVTPLLQALLLEEAEQERGSLIDLAVGKPKPGSLLYFVGPGRIFRPDQEVEEIAHPELGVSLQDAQAIQATREEQERVMKSIGESKPETAVWIGRGSMLLASIASVRWLKPGNFRSYMSVPPFGVLGMLEDTAEETALLAPLMIWHDMASRGNIASAAADD